VEEGLWILNRLNHSLSDTLSIHFVLKLLVLKSKDICLMFISEIGIRTNKDECSSDLE
jgi:hypothetical protein